MKKIIPFAFILLLFASQTYAQETTRKAFFAGTDPKIAGIEIPDKMHCENEIESIMFFEDGKNVKTRLFLNKENKFKAVKTNSEEQKELEKKLVDAYQKTYLKKAKIRKRICVKVKGQNYFLGIIFKK